MKYRVVALRRADADVRHIVRWIARRSTDGANSWLDAYGELIARLERDADSFAAASEDASVSIPLKQALFRTPHGRIYRAIFTIAGDQVRILRVRGPGQPPLAQDEVL